MYQDQNRFAVNTEFLLEGIGNASRHARQLSEHVFKALDEEMERFSSLLAACTSRSQQREARV